MKRAAKDVESFDDLSDSNSDEDNGKNNKFGIPNKSSQSQGELVRKAEMYQSYMKLVPIPSFQGSNIPFTSWQGLTSSLKKLHQQPLHYLTNRQLAQWDRQREGTSDDDASIPLDDIIHPAKAEALVWLTEQVHRLTTSPLYLAEIWSNHAFYHQYIDPIFSQES